MFLISTVSSTAGENQTCMRVFFIITQEKCVTHTRSPARGGRVMTDLPYDVGSLQTLQEEE